MAMYLATDTELTSIADAIRTKGGTAVSLPFPDGFISAINSIPTGITPTGTSVITANGVYDVTSFASASVSVPTGITPTGTYSVSANGIYDITNYASVDVNVSGGGGEDTLGLMLTNTLSQYSNSTASYIHSNAFNQCTNLVSVEFTNVSYIHSGAFYNAGIVDASFPICTSIGSFAFGLCPIVNASFSRVLTLNTSAFRQCSQLETIYFPLATDVSSYAFYGDAKLQYAVFPSASMVRASAFQNCTSLSYASFDVVKQFAASAFNGCSKLESLYVLTSTVCTLANINVLSKTPMSDSSYLGYFGSIYVPASLVSNYQASTNWKSYSARITAYVE